MLGKANSNLGCLIPTYIARPTSKKRPIDGGNDQHMPSAEGVEERNVRLGKELKEQNVFGLYLLFVA